MITRRLAAALSVASALALAPAPSFAQGGLMGGGGSKKPISVVVSGGLTVPSGDLKNFNDTGFHYDGSLIFNLAGLPIALRPEVSLTTFKLKKNVTGTPVPSTSYGSSSDNTRLLGAIGNIEVPLAAGLYLIAGLGALNIKTTVAGLAASDSTQTALTFGAGAGFRFHISRIAGFVEGRLGSASYDKKKFGYSQAQFIPITFGLVF